MSLLYKELDFKKTPIGDLMLRRRRTSQTGDIDIYEIKLGDDYLMTSLFHEAEDQLAILGLKATQGTSLDIVVGGLGLGYTAVAALKDPRIETLTIIEYLDAIIDWHKSNLVPMGEVLNNDSRCQVIHDDFFALSKDSKKNFNPKHPQSKHDAILLDIDHTPTNVLHQTNTHFYTKDGLTELATHLKPGGTFAMWADGHPEDSFVEQLKQVFDSANGHTVEFGNHITGNTTVGAVYVAKTHS